MVKTVEELQNPSSLRLAMGELNANELRVAQAAVRFAHFHLTNLEGLIPAAKNSVNAGSDGDDKYAEGWNDCRMAILSRLVQQRRPELDE
jgi:hypothetical protein